MTTRLEPLPPLPDFVVSDSPESPTIIRVGELCTALDAIVARVHLLGELPASAFGDTDLAFLTSARLERTATIMTHVARRIHERAHQAVLDRKDD